ncbi:MAG: Uma2 family endonuclease [Cyclobacteriaceae bacterium]|jgi:Uma2 family endonuclease|nr:Uma2 family endonuclease [Cyclobacteriaceae bacterium]
MTTKIIASPPRTAMEVFEMLPEGTLAEVIEGQFFMSPAPNTNHFKVAKRISRALDGLVEDTQLGHVFYAPFDVYLDPDTSAVQPDIFVIRNGNPGTLEPKGNFHGVPDFIVEVLSASNRAHDLITKKNLYEKYRVGEYWIVDPESKEVVGYELENGKFKRVSASAGKITSRLFQVDISF